MAYKPAYQIGHWTPKTKETLEFIQEKNRQGTKPTIKEMGSGTLINWTYTLKKAGYLVDNEGLYLTDQGIGLLRELLDNPPIERRGRSVKGVVQQPWADGAPVSSTPDVYRITVHGRELAFEILLNKDSALEAVSLLSNLKKK